MFRILIGVSSSDALLSPAENKLGYGIRQQLREEMAVQREQFAKEREADAARVRDLQAAIQEEQAKESADAQKIQELEATLKGEQDKQVARVRELEQSLAGEEMKVRLKDEVGGVDADIVEARKAGNKELVEELTALRRRLVATEDAIEPPQERQVEVAEAVKRLTERIAELEEVDELGDELRDLEAQIRAAVRQGRGGVLYGHLDRVQCILGCAGCLR